MKRKLAKTQNSARPRPYRMVKRKARTEENRERTLASARTLLLSEDFSEFSMEAVARQAGVIRPTLYYQFKSKAGLLEAVAAGGEPPRAS